MAADSASSGLHPAADLAVRDVYLSVSPVLLSSFPIMEDVGVDSWREPHKVD